MRDAASKRNTGAEDERGSVSGAGMWPWRSHVARDLRQ